MWLQKQAASLLESEFKGEILYNPAMAGIEPAIS